MAVVPAADRCVDVLRSLLQQAERGELSGVAVAVTLPDLSTASQWCMEEATLAELIGAVAILQARLVRQVAA